MLKTDDSMKEVITFYDRIAPYYDLIYRKESWRALKAGIEENQLIAKLKNYTNINKVLDCGTGTGFYSILLANHGYKVIGCDISSKMLAEANKNLEKYLKQQNNCKFIEADFRKLSDHFERGTFDAVISFGNTLSHISLSELESTFKEMREILKPGGICIFEFDNLESFKTLPLPDRYSIHFEEISISKSNSEKLIAFDIWNFLSQEVISHVFILENKENQWNTKDFILRFFPHKPDEVSSLICRAGFNGVSIEPMSLGKSRLDAMILLLQSHKVIKRKTVIIQADVGY